MALYGHTLPQPLKLAFTRLPLPSLSELFPATSDGPIPLTLHFRASGGARTSLYYTLRPEVLRRAEEWRLAQQPRPTDEEFACWLDHHGAQLDRADGPAVLKRWANGSYHEEWHRHGALHREGGPAVIEDYTDRPRREAWWRDGIPQPPPFLKVR